MADRELIAVRDFSYSTRRLKAGDRFSASERDAKVLIAIKRAQEPRKVGKVPPPPAEVVERVGTSTPTADEAFAGFLDRSIPDIAADIADLSDGMLANYLAAEKAGKSRKGLIAAFEAEQEARKGQ